MKLPSSAEQEISLIDQVLSLQNELCKKLLSSLLDTCDINWAEIEFEIFGRDWGMDTVNS